MSPSTLLFHLILHWENYFSMTNISWIKICLFYYSLVLSAIASIFESTLNGYDINFTSEMINLLTVRRSEPHWGMKCKHWTDRLCTAQYTCTALYMYIACVLCMDELFFFYKWNLSQTFNLNPENYVWSFKISLTNGDI